MIIYPAIDIMDGKPVRLSKGDYDTMEVVADSVLAQIARFEADGAHYVHLVDLDGAKAKESKNAQLIAKAASSVTIPVQTGGGIRTMEQARAYMEGGLSRLILGTAAIKDPAFLKAALDAYGDQIAVGMDCLNEDVKINGWLESAGVSIFDMAKQMEEMGVKTLIVTDISKDGMMQGCNHDLYRKLKACTDCDIIASGGISTLEDIEALEKAGCDGAIVGKALYQQAFTLKEAMKAGNDL